METIEIINVTMSWLQNVGTNLIECFTSFQNYIKVYQLNTSKLEINVIDQECEARPCKQNSKHNTQRFATGFKIIHDDYIQ